MVSRHRKGFLILALSLLLPVCGQKNSEAEEYTYINRAKTTSIFLEDYDESPIEDFTSGEPYHAPELPDLAQDVHKAVSINFRPEGEEDFTSGQTSIGQEVADFALQYVGGPYAWGGTSLTAGADCSGFVLSVYANFGYDLPHYAASQAQYGNSVPYDLTLLEPGDLIFYSNGWEISHVAIYIGDGQIVHAENYDYGITVSPIDYQPVYCCRRLLS